MQLVRQTVLSMEYIYILISLVFLFIYLTNVYYPLSFLIKIYYQFPSLYMNNFFKKKTELCSHEQFITFQFLKKKIQTFFFQLHHCTF
jgi:hypothetical protein